MRFSVLKARIPSLIHFFKTFVFCDNGGMAIMKNSVISKKNFQIENFFELGEGFGGEGGELQGKKCCSTYC